MAHSLEQADEVARGQAAEAEAARKPAVEAEAARKPAVEDEAARERAVEEAAKQTAEGLRVRPWFSVTLSCMFVGPHLAR